MHLLEKALEKTIKHRKVVISVVLILAIISVAVSKNLKFDNSVSIWFLENDPEIKVYREFLKTFKTDEVLIIHAKTKKDEVFTPHNLEKIHRLTEKIKKVKYVEDVLSITDGEIIYPRGDEIVVSPPFSNFPPSEEEIERAKNLIRGTEIEKLVSEDGRSTLILAYVKHIEEDISYKEILVEKVKGILQEMEDGLSFGISGLPAFDYAFLKHSKKDMEINTPAVLLFITITFLVLFRSFFILGVVLTMILISILYTFGFMGAMGYKITILSVLIPAVISAIGVADSVHIISEFEDEIRKEKSGEEGGKPINTKSAITQTIGSSLKKMFLPCLLTSVTTAAGFLSLTSSYLKPVRELGIQSAFGVICTFLLTFTFLPAALSYIPTKTIDKLKSSSDLKKKVVGKIVGVGWRYSKLIVLLSSVLIAIFLLGITKIHVGTNMLSYFRENSPLLKDTEEIDRKFGGTFPVEVILKVEKGKVISPEVMDKLWTIHKSVDSCDFCGDSFSIAKVLWRLKEIIVGENEAGSATNKPKNESVGKTRAREEETHTEKRNQIDIEKPATNRMSQEELSQLFLLIEGTETQKRYVSDDGEKARLSFMVHGVNYDEVAQKLKNMFDKIEKEAEEDKIDVAITGLAHLFIKVEQYIVDTQLKSFAISFLVVIGLIAVFFRSAKIGFLSMIPNIPTIIIILGLMGWLGINLDAGTSLVAGVLLGIVVDDTIHFLSRRKMLLSMGYSEKEAVEETIKSSGLAIITTSLILSFGFSVLMLGEFKPNINFGFLSTCAVLLALIFDIFVLPAVLRIIHEEKSTR